MASNAHILLSDLRPGEEGRVAAFDPDAPAELRNRVLALGFVPGTLVRTIRKAPFGDPTEYELRGGRISLRRSEARLVTISR